MLDPIYGLVQAKKSLITHITKHLAVILSRQKQRNGENIEAQLFYKN